MLCFFVWLSLQNGIGTVLHEIGHAIGLFHEHSRPDRDEHVTLHYENLKPGFENNVKLGMMSLITTNDIPYDHASIMHYSRYVSINHESS